MRILAPLVLLTACGGGGSTDIKGTLKFADRTDEEIARLISAATGADMFMLQAQLDQFADSTESCPAVTIDAATVTLTGGCTTMDGVMIEGTATIKNSVAWEDRAGFEYGFASPSTWDATAMSFVQTGFTQRFDGFATVDDAYRKWDADLTTEQLGMSVRSDLYYSCSQSSCELSGSGVELIGVGGATASGTVKVSGTADASFTLRGVDVLKVTLTQQCIAWRIEGTTRAKMCP